MEHPDIDDPFWEPYRFFGGLDRAQVPVLLIGGWQDLFLEQTIEQYHRLHNRNADVALTIGPWTHMHMTTKAAPAVLRESLDWLGEHLGGRPAPPRSPVRVFVTGSGGWRGSARLAAVDHRARPVPANRADWRPSPPTAGARGRRSRSTRDTPPPRWAADCCPPKWPPPRRQARRTRRRPCLHRRTADRGRLCLRPAGGGTRPRIRQPLRRRVRAGQRGRHEGSFPQRERRLPPAGAPARRTGTLRLELDEIAHRFRAGSRIRVLVAGGSHPRYTRNLGTGEDQARGSRMAPATHVIHHGGRSRLVLPVGAAHPSAD